MLTQSKVVILPQWKCNECGDLHITEWRAEQCCPPQVGQVYVCPVCGDEHHTEKDAIACCGFDPGAPPPPPTMAELEAAGQLRLSLQRSMSGASGDVCARSGFDSLPPLTLTMEQGMGTKNQPGKFDVYPLRQRGW